MSAGFGQKSLSALACFEYPSANSDAELQSRDKHGTRIRIKVKDIHLPLHPTPVV